MATLKPKTRLLFAMFMIMCGCNTIPAKTVLQNDSLETCGNETIVFGRLRIIENRIEKTHYKGWTSRHQITLVNIDEETTIANLDVREGGEFIWIIPKGKYLLTHVTSFELNGVLDYFPQVAFHTLPGEPGETQYLGTLQISATTKKSGFTNVLEDYQIAIMDDFGKDSGLAVEIHRKTGTVLKRHMIHDARLPKITRVEVNRDLTMKLLYTLSLVLQTSY